MPPTERAGFSSQMFFDTETGPDDHVAMFGPMTVEVNQAPALHLIGSTLNDDDGLQAAGFSIGSRNATRSGGLGPSFG